MTRYVSRSLAHHYAEPLFDQAENPAGIWTVLSNFGEPNLVNELCGTHAHRLENILTLDYTCHDWFNQLDMWFDKVDPLVRF